MCLVFVKIIPQVNDLKHATASPLLTGKNWMVLLYIFKISKPVNFP